MTPLISTLKLKSCKVLLPEEQLSMEIAQLCKSTYNNQLQQYMICLYHKRNMSQIWQVNTLWQSQSYRSHHNAYLHGLTNVPTKYQSFTSYGNQEITWTRF